MADNGLLDARQDVLDVGSGDAWFLTELLNELPAASTGMAWDLGYEVHTLDALGLRRTTALDFTREAPEQRFSLLLMLDVLEHVRDDAAFLVDRITKNLDPAGTLLISVPAWPALFSSHDVALGHFRRYRPSELRRLLDNAGLRIQRSGGLFHSLMLPRALVCAAERRKPRAKKQVASELSWTHGAVVTRAVDFALRVDNGVSELASARGLTLPGLSFWALCTLAGGTGRARPR